MICPKCGNNLPDTVLMCPGCGQKFEFDVEPGYFVVKHDEEEEKKTSPLFYIGMVVLIAVVLIIGRKIAMNKIADELSINDEISDENEFYDWDVFDTYVGKYVGKDSRGNDMVMNIAVTELGVCTVDIMQDDTGNTHTYYYAEAKVEGDNLMLFGTLVDGNLVKHDCDFGTLRRLSDNLVMWKYNGEHVFSATTDNINFMMDMPPKKEEPKEQTKKSDAEETSDEETSDEEDSDEEDSDEENSDEENSDEEGSDEEGAEEESADGEVGDN